MRARGQRLLMRASHPAGGEAWSFAAELLTDSGDELILAVRAGEPVAGPVPWAWSAAGELHCWRSRPYSVLVTTRAQRFPYWYCAIHTPPQLSDEEIHVIDLGLDIQLFADGRYSIGGVALDPAEYPDLAHLGSVAVDEVVGLMAQKLPPFTGRAMPAVSEDE